jgi:DNA-binding CsgD family transcriptional regulator
LALTHRTPGRSRPHVPELRLFSDLGALEGTGSATEALAQARVLDCKAALLFQVRAVRWDRPTPRSQYTRGRNPSQRAGAKGYLLKDNPPEELVSGIEKAKAHRDDTVFGGQIAARVAAELRRTSRATSSADRVSELSEGKTEVVGLVWRGATNAESSRTLYISEGTARNHAPKILRKLGLRDRTQLALYAVEHGWSERR